MAGPGHQGTRRRAGRRNKKLTALLDHQAAAARGVQIEGDNAPTTTDMDAAAIRCWNLLATGQGGMDLGGLELAMAWLGITDVDGLMHRLYLIRTHTPPAPQGVQASAHNDSPEH